MIHDRDHNMTSGVVRRGSSGGALRRLVVSLAVLCPLIGATAPQANPVYVDASPRAWELFRLARDQARDNVSEAVRIYQELLDDYAMKLLPVNETSADHFVAVRARVLAEVLGDDRLLKRYRLTETAQARRLLEAGQLRRLAITRSTTEPGLEALLRLAQDDLESARFHSAMTWLWQAVKHPDLRPQRAAHCWFMLGLAAHYVSDASNLERAVRSLTDLGTDGQVLKSRLDALIITSPDGIGATPVQQGISPLDRARSADLDQLVGQPIWSIRLSDMPLGRRLIDPISGEPPASRLVEQLQRSGAMLTAAATVSGSAAYVNEGRTIRAVDRFTGRPLWPPYVDRPMMPAIDQLSRQIADLNIVALSDGVLVTLTGHAYADPVTSDRKVICLDAQDGALRWEARIDHLAGGGELDGLFPHGAPVITEGGVYVLARKISRQLLTSCYMIALDLEDGRLRWVRHVATSGGIRAHRSRPFSTPVFHRGDLVVATAIGAVARINAATGQTRWLRRYHPPLSASFSDRRPWEMVGPVVTPRGVLALRPDHRRVVLLDWDTGEEIESVGTGPEAWDSPRYFLADEQSVYAVGSEIRAFSLDSLDRPMWRFPDAAQHADHPSGFGVDGAEIRGRVQLVDGALIVPTHDGLVVVDVETGRVLHRIDVELGGNPLVAGSQLILAGSDRLQSYMPLRRAEQMLRQQLAAAPSDPAPAIALVRLGMRVRDLDLALEAADLVLRTVNNAPTDRDLSRARRELLDILLELDQKGIAQTIEQGEDLHAKIGFVAFESDQRVEHLLAYGQWLSSHALGGAVEAYQAILSTPTLAAAGRTWDGVVRPAAAWAAQRIRSLIEAHGQEVYRPQADLARLRLQMLRRDPRAKPEQFIALAHEFPFSDSAVEAGVRAGAGGDDRTTADALTAVYRLAPGQQRATRLLGLLVSNSEQAGWLSHARAVLQHVVDIYGDTSLMSTVGRRDAATWLASLKVGTTAHRRPWIGEAVGLADRLPEALVPYYWPVTAAPPPDRALLYDSPSLHLITGPRRDPLWSTDLKDHDTPYILRFDSRGLLLWVISDVGDTRAVLIDPADGTQRWTTPSLTDHLGDPDPDRPGARGGDHRMPNGQPLDPSEILPLVSSNALVLVRRSGEVIAFDPGEGTTPRWPRALNRGLDEVHEAQLRDFALVLAGVQVSDESGDRVPKILVVNPNSGETIYKITPLGGLGVKWMTIGPLGSMVYGTAAGIEMVDLLSGETLWANVSRAAKGAHRAWPAGGYVVVQSPSAQHSDGMNPLRSIRLQDGAMSPPFDTPFQGVGDRLDLRDLLIDDGRIFARYGHRIVRFDHQGRILGAEMVGAPRDYKWLLPTGDRLVVISRYKSEQVTNPGLSGRQTQHTYRLYALSENCKLMGEVFQLPSLPQRLTQAVVIDGWVFLSTASSTVAVAVPHNP
ncbi:MAG: PQQ-like beta-propeller repeat protein [Planctomycetes bacterium]|nr:PQQ-like beta-propeller repeat protein [Planctomycetota bacterium]